MLSCPDIPLFPCPIVPVTSVPEFRSQVSQHNGVPCLPCPTLSTSVPQFPSAPVTGSTHCRTYRRSGVSMSYVTFKCYSVPGSRGSSAPSFKCPVVPVYSKSANVTVFQCPGSPTSRVSLRHPSAHGAVRFGASYLYLPLPAPAAPLTYRSRLPAAAPIVPWRRLRCSGADSAVASPPICPRQCRQTERQAFETAVVCGLIAWMADGW